MGFFRITLVENGKIKTVKKLGESERPVNEEPMTDCCDVHFTYPGWPDSDLCSECFEHAGISEDG